MTFDEVLHRFHATPNGDGYKAHCPVHKDDKQSLSINLKNGKILLHCFAGCDTDAVPRRRGPDGKRPVREQQNRQPQVPSRRDVSLLRSARAGTVSETAHGE